MKQLLYGLWVLIAVAGGTLPLRAEERSAELLQRLQERIESMGGYHIRFAVQIEGRQIGGDCHVRGERCYLCLGDAELYADAVTRYEVDPAKQEVVIDTIDPASHNLLQNPARAFRSLSEDFDHRVQSEAAGYVTLKLEPKSRSVGISSLTLILEARSATPCSLLYDAEGEELLITISSFEPSDGPLPSFDAAAYPNYELIDFR